MFGFSRGKTDWARPRLNSSKDSRMQGIRSMTLGKVAYKGDRVLLAVPLEVEVKYSGEGYVVSCEEVLCLGEGRSLDSALRDFSSDFLCGLDIARRYGREGNPESDRIVYHVEGRRCP
ncbi:MAG: hypothetical protein E7Z68_08340 [Thermoplasmata archaeon]|nr:hypothetical protein [Thermoplasmata archaeon]